MKSMKNNNISHYNEIVLRINKLKENKPNIIIAVDGPSGSGKTTLTSFLKDYIDADVVHMDDFYLPSDMRTQERYNTPGGNVHYERFSEEVLKPLSDNKQYLYKAFDCSTMDYKKPLTVNPKPITIVEGSYSCHPFLSAFYDLKIYLDIDADTQFERIIIRNGIHKAQDFKNKWIPLENKYFKEFNIKDNCDIIIDSKEC